MNVAIVILCVAVICLAVVSMTLWLAIAKLSVDHKATQTKAADAIAQANAVQLAFTSQASIDRGHIEYLDECITKLVTQLAGGKSG